MAEVATSQRPVAEFVYLPSGNKMLNGAKIFGGGSFFFFFFFFCKEKVEERRGRGQLASDSQRFSEIFILSRSCAC